MENEKKKMPTDIKVFILISVVVIAIIAGAIITLVKPKDVAIVGKNKVTSAEFQYYLSYNIQNVLMYKSADMDTQTFLNSSLGEGTVMDLVREQTLQQVAEIEFLLQEAKKESYEVEAKELDEAWSAMEDNLIQNAEMYGMSVKDFCKEVFGVRFNQVKNIYKDQWISQKYKEKKTNEFPVDDTDLTAFYEENKQYLDYNSVRHILITCARDAEEATIEEKSNTAQEILDRVNSGEDFSALVKEFSEDTASVESGGVIQVQQNGQMVPEFEEWAFSHNVGDTGIVRTDYGFHIMILDSINDSLESQRENITNLYQSDKYQKEIDESLDTDEYKITLEKGYYE